MIDWHKVIPPDMLHLVRPETRSKYFPKNPLRQFLISRFLEKLLELVRKTGAEKILDIGSGEGLVDFFLSRDSDKSLDIWGGDYDIEVLPLSQRVNPEGSYLGLDAKFLPFADQSFELVMMNEVLEHMTDYEKALSEASRVTKKSAIFSVPEWPFYQSSNLLIGKNLRTLGEHPDHVVQFTAGKLRQNLLEQFKGRVETYRRFPWILALAEK